jgi:MoxR-like ATPase
MSATVLPVRNYGFAFTASNTLWVAEPWQHTGRHARIYLNGYAEGTPASGLKKDAIAKTMYLYRTSNGDIGVSGPEADRRIADRYIEKYSEAAFGVPARLGGTITPERWQELVLRCSGVGNNAAIEAMYSMTTLRRTYSRVVGVTGVQYPKKGIMHSDLAAVPIDSAVASNPWFNGLHDDPRPLFHHDGQADADARTPSAPADDLVVVQEAAPSSRPDTPLPFNPDAMTHGELVRYAEKGFQSAVLIAEADDKLIASRDRRVKAEQERDAAIAERDEAIKRAAMVQPVSTEVIKGNGTVEIDGVTLPTFEGGHGPARIDGYDLSAWRAVCSVADWQVTASAPQVAASIMAGDSVRLVGPPSVGKTSGIREVCAITGAKFFLVPCGEGATDLSLIAERVIDKGGEFIWRDGFITQAVRWAIDHPETLCIAVLDEVDHLVPEVQSLLHSVLEGGHLCVNPEETLTVPSNMRFVATANTSGMGDVTGHHASAKVSDTAFTSRWNATYTVAYLPNDAETRLLVNAGAPAEQAEQAVRCANMTRSSTASVTQPIVLRQLLAWARACGRGEAPQSAWAWRVMTSTPEHDRPALRELTRTCFGW